MSVTLDFPRPVARPYQSGAVDAFFEQGGDGLIEMFTGAGKCLGKGTPVLMLDGTVKPVEEVVVGDMLMGPDSKPRRVKSLARGRETLYRVVPVKGEPFVVNESHILSLKDTRSGRIENIEVREYLGKNACYHHMKKGWRSAVEFPELAVPVDPYFLGLWLADGSSASATIYKPDPEVEDACRQVAKNYGYEVVQVEKREGFCPGWRITPGKHGPDGNALINDLRTVGVQNNKHIPHLYLANCFAIRMQVLAGLMDGDGSLTNGGYDYISASERLARDVVFLARSVGLAAYIKETEKACQNGFRGTYWRVSISGHCSIIPCRIPRKKAAPRRQKKDVLRFGFTLEKLDEGDYYGFEIDGPDRLFLLGDFTVTHNTVLCGLISRRLTDHTGQRPGRTVFLAHTDELVRQTCRTMLRMGLWPKVEKADEYHGDEYIPDQRERRKLFGKRFPPTDWFQFDRILCSSMQTFVGRMEKYREGGFDLCVVDEAHLARCATYQKIVDKLLEFNPKMRLLGVTATPFRQDGKNLGTMFPKFFYRMRILDGIEQGYLVPIRCEKAVAKGMDESVWKVGTTKHGRDVTDSSLSKSMNNTECIESIAHEIIEKGEDRKGIIFLPGIKVAESVTAALNAIRPGIATFVHGKVPKKERKRRVRMHEDGDVKLMVGVMAMTTGYDVPDVSLVVLARMTQSKGLVAQKIGRGLRVLAHCIEGKHTAEERRAAIAASEKRDLLILDFSNSSRHRFASADDVLLSSDDPKLADFVRQHKDQTDKRKVREQLEELESLYELEEALRATGGPPPKATFTYEHVNLFGSGGYQKDKVGPKVDDARRPTNELISQAYDVMIPVRQAESMTHNQLQDEVNKRRELRCGRKNFGFLVGVCNLDKAVIDAMRLNWHDATYLKRLVNARPTRNLPDNWQDLVERFRSERQNGGKS